MQLFFRKIGKLGVIQGGQLNKKEVRDGIIRNYLIPEE